MKIQPFENVVGNNISIIGVPKVNVNVLQFVNLIHLQVVPCSCWQDL